MHSLVMRRLSVALTLLLAACATAPRQQPQPVIVTPSVQSRSDLLGLTAAELVQRFGGPALQVREGASLKLQFRRRGCVLDAYLYAAPTGGVERVAHVDTRLPSGADTNQLSCIAAMQGP